MKEILPLFIMVDACGWEIVKNDPFCSGTAPVRKKLTSVFGYSSACVPSILSGRWPSQHRNWCYFVHDPKHSPFQSLSALRWLPKAVTSRRIFRRWLTRMVKKQLDFRGYFDLYNIPFEHIALYDFTEKKSPLRPGGMNQGPNIFDYLEEQAVPYFVSDPLIPEEANRDHLIQKIDSESIDFGFVYWAGLDGLLHSVGNDSPEIAKRLRMYDTWIQEVLRHAKAHYKEVRLYVFSDHGMANCDVHLDLRAKIEALDAKMGKDYVVVYDSTMARFWFFNEEARQSVTRVLNGVPEGRIIPENELRQLNAFFPDHYFGELIFLVKEGVLIVPSHMGERPIRAMHGYHPSEKHSFATLFTNQTHVSEDVTAIPHIHQLMVEGADEAKQRNHEAELLRQSNIVEPLIAV